MPDFEKVSYERHADHFAADLVDQKRIQKTETWFDETTADYWRHQRMYEPVRHLAHDTSATWLTVGDGRFGLDAIQLKRIGIKKVLATDISEHLLAESKRRGLIDDYRVENAEGLSFADASFDYVLCKESYHHFPRPMVALYEMIRVARRGVVLIEPNDERGRTRLRRRMKDFVKRLRGRHRTKVKAAYEESGNFVYGISRREMEKVCLGLNLPQLALKGLNDTYIEGVELETTESPMMARLEAEIAKRDKRCRRGLAEPDLLMCCIFKRPVEEATRSYFVENGWVFLDLPRNPYANESPAS